MITDDKTTTQKLKHYWRECYPLIFWFALMIFCIWGVEWKEALKTIFLFISSDVVFVCVYIYVKHLDTDKS